MTPSDTNKTDNTEIDDLFPCISCGVNADPADGFGKCTCGNEKLRAALETIITQRCIEELENLDVVEPCEPDCSEVRHALHQGSWNAHLKIEDRIAALNKEEGETK